MLVLGEISDSRELVDATRNEVQSELLRSENQDFNSKVVRNAEKGKMELFFDGFNSYGVGRMG